MAKISFHNTFPTFSAAKFWETFDERILDDLPLDLEIIFPWDIPGYYDRPRFKLNKQVFAEREREEENLRSQAQQAEQGQQDDQAEQNQLSQLASEPFKPAPYRIVFAPRAQLNNVCGFEWKDLGWSFTQLQISAEDVRRVPSPNVYRLPQWCIELFGLCPTIAQIQSIIDQLEARRIRRGQTPFTRPKFYADVCTNHKSFVYQDKPNFLIWQLLNDEPEFVGKVFEFGGRFLNNTAELYTKYNNDVVEYYKQFTFVNCVESNALFGNVTAKLVRAWRAGAIPIFWGDLSLDEHIINKRALVNFVSSRRIELVSNIKYLYQKQEQFLAEPIFLPGAAEAIYKEYYVPWLAKLTHDLNLDITQYVKQVERTADTKFFPEKYDKLLARRFGLL